MDDGVAQATAPVAQKIKIEPPYYPIVYVRGYAMRAAEREENFRDTYYGFSATSVEKRQAPPPDYFKADVFEGQLIRFMKLRDYAYADSTNSGERLHGNPARSIWISRFYDQDYFSEQVRSIEAHAEDLRKLICEVIPARLKASNVDTSNYKVILIAHSMGGLVCRTLIQNSMSPPVPPGSKQKRAELQNPRNWIHRLVTLGTPHKGIDLGRIPDVLEKFVTSQFNPFDANIFNESRMREYLNIPDGHEASSLGDPEAPHAFPPRRCLCIVGSDHRAYSAVREVTGSFSDGLVKQDRAYVVAGPKPENGDYAPAMRSFYANVHRAHSGPRGIVNSYESFENIQRFLFGNIRADVALDGLAIATPSKAGFDYFYDFEFLLSIRNSGAYLHRREQDPCENALRIEREKLPKRLPLHTVFMNSKLKDGDQYADTDAKDAKFCYFAFKLRVLEHQVKPSLLWDREYPEKPIYNETIEVRVGDSDPTNPGDELQYRWMSDGSDAWETAKPEANGEYRISLRGQGALKGELVVAASLWPDPKETQD